MKKLAIIGHPTRGKEVISLLEMLGHINKHNYSADCDSLCFYGDKSTNIVYYDWANSCYEDENILVFTLEQFLEKFPYKVGDKVKVPYEDGRITGNELYEYKILKIKWDYLESTIKYGLPTGNEQRIEYYSTNNLNIWNKKETVEEIKIDIPRGYEFSGVDDNKQQIVFTKIQLKYPKTYKECCEVLGCKADDFFTNFGYNGCDVEISEYEDKVDDLLQNFRKLRYCRDAYWKIEGEQMGLGKPWEPDLENEELYCIQNYNKQIIKSKTNTAFNKILIFPTEEMRDVFYENFKDLIEQCKELL